MESPLKNAHEYLYGIGKNQNIAKALDIYQKEADKSNPEAQICLGQILK
jgi:TPR repeat protein